MKTLKRTSNIKLQLEVSLVSIDLDRSHGNDLGTIEGANEFVAADPQLALARLDPVVLHPSRPVCDGTVNPFTMDWNRGGDVAHNQ